MTLLRRLGNKSKIANTILSYFPEHRLYIEPFFGAGGLFFSKPKAPYNIVNDIDADVFNLFQVLMTNKQELQKEFAKTPIHTDLIEYWKANQEHEPIKKALRFLHLSNFTLMGKGDTLKLTAYNNAKELVEHNFEPTHDFLKDVQFTNYDFRKFLKSISFNSERPKEKINTFIYADPPYLKTSNNYSHSFTESDTTDLFDCLIETGCRFAVSEFDNDFILAEASKRDLIVNYIGERHNLKNRRTEILITNFEHRQLDLFNPNHQLV